MESPLVSLLKGPRQFLIPIYQRPYSWTEEQCVQLWEDVLRVAREDKHPAHFIGSVVYIEHGLYHASSIPQLLVIDGQQRLTTFTLMIVALARALDARQEDGQEPEPGGVTARKLQAYHLFNMEEDGDLRFKLVLSPGDADTLRAVLDGKDLPEHPARRVMENLEFFQERLEEDGVSPEEVYAGLNKLLIVDVALDRERDNPQLIFESLNSTGLDLSQADLVRNFVLMGLEPAKQQELYRDHWQPMERALRRPGGEDVFDRFLRAWLSLHVGEVPKLGQGYQVFKQYRAEQSDQPIEELVADLHRRARHYAAIALGRESNPKLQRFFQGLQDLRIDAPMPFLMHAYGLWEDERLSEEGLIEIARLLESWLFRRSVCDIPSNVLSRLFAALPGTLDEDDLATSFAAWLLLRRHRQRFPHDEEFQRALVTRNLYDFKHRQYCLTRLENEGRKERVDIGAYTIEHVLPQNENLSAEWQAMLGPDWKRVQESWLHTLGNLTLTGYNPELSDRPFAMKQSMEGGFQDSPLRLNQLLARAATWNEQAIRQRAEQLASKAASIWPAPEAPETVLESMRERVGSRRPKLPVWNEYTDMGHWPGWSQENKDLLQGFLDRAVELGLAYKLRKRHVNLQAGDEGASKLADIEKRKQGFLVRCFLSSEAFAGPVPGSRTFERRRRGGHGLMMHVKSPEDGARFLEAMKDALDRSPEALDPEDDGED